MMTVCTDLNAALFSSSFNLTESNICSFNEIVSGISKSDKNSCCLKVVYRGLDDFGTNSEQRTHSSHYNVCIWSHHFNIYGLQTFNINLDLHQVPQMRCKPRPRFSSYTETEPLLWKKWLMVPVVNEPATFGSKFKVLNY